MTITLKLFKLQIDEIYNIFKGRNIKKLLWSVLKYVFLLAMLSLAVYVLLIQVVMVGIVINGQLVAIVLMITQAISLVFAAGNIMSNLFFSANNELLLSMPASHNNIFLSKMLVIYTQEVFINSVYTFPLLLVLGVLAKFSWVFFALLPVYMLILPLLPLSLAALIAVPAAKVLKFFKKHVIISTAAILTVVAALLVIYVNALAFFAGFNLGERQIDTVVKINSAVAGFKDSNPVFMALAQGLIYPGKLYWVLAYIGVSATFLTGAVFLIRPFFLKTAMGSREESVSKGGAGGKSRFKKQSAFASLIKKEFLTVFRSPGYVFQYFIFALLMPIIVILYDRLLLSMDIVTKTGTMMIAGAHVLIVALLAMLSNIISASAISREGGNFYIIKTAPVDYYTQTLAKVVFNAVFTVVAVVVTAIATLTAGSFTPLSLGAGTVICATVAVIFVSFGHICLSFDMDLKKPALNWNDSGDISKISGNTAKSIIWAMGLALFMGIFIIVLASAGRNVLSWAILIFLSVVFCFYRVYVLILRVSYQYERLEM